MRSAHLRRIEPLWRTDQESRARHGIRRDGAARAPRRSCRGAGDASRRAHFRRSRGEGEGARDTRGRRRSGRRGSRGGGRAHRRRRAARRALAQEVRAPSRGPGADFRYRSRRVLRLLRYGRLPRGLRGVSREAQAAVRRTMSEHPGPLRGMRVLELAQIMAGPTCGMLLADMGADVVKVEKLPGGDDARGYREPQVNGVSAPFMMLNRNKRGLALNLKHPRGREVLLRMVQDADVLTENYRRGTLEKLGLGYDVLAQHNPG